MTKDERIDQLSRRVMELEEQLKLAQIRAADSEDKAQALAARAERLQSYAKDVLKYLRKNGEYAPICHEYPTIMAEETPSAALDRVKAEAINDARRCIAIVSHAREGAGYVDGMVDADTQWNGKLKAYAQRLIDEAGE